MWSHSRTCRAGAWLSLTALLALAAPAPQAARGQESKPAEKVQPKVKTAPTLKLKEPVASRVYQRDRDGKADIPVVLDESQGIEDATIASASITGPLGTQVKFEDGKIVGVPTGGPYAINVRAKVGGVLHNINVGNVFVGDLWVLAGQSNMEGVGDLIDVTPPNDQVMLLGMDGNWSRAEEPLHWLVDSPDQVHSGNPDDRAKRSAEFHKTRAKGAGLGLPFAEAMVRATGVPVGLVATAHGGTSMAQWDPAKKGEGGNSLYGSMLRQFKLAGGKVKGVLWYQGESDAMNPEATKIYAKTFADFIAAVRADFGQPDLPFYYVQIGRFIIGGSPTNWNAVQDDERRLVERVPNTAVVATIDLELDDLIHVGTQGLKRVGNRLAKVALRELFGQSGATTPTFDRVNKGANNTLVVKFKGVNIAPEPVMFQGMMGGMGGGMSSGGFRQVPVRAGMAPGTGSPQVVGLKPSRHIAGFSIRKEDGTELPLIFDAAVGDARDTVILKLKEPAPEKSFLWYGYGFDPYCNLVDALDMAVPVFGPIPLDDAK